MIRLCCNFDAGFYGSNLRSPSTMMFGPMRSLVACGRNSPAAAAWHATCTRPFLIAPPASCGSMLAPIAAPRRRGGEIRVIGTKNGTDVVYGDVDIVYIYISIHIDVYRSK